MDRETFEAELKRDGYDIQTNTTPGVKVNPEHSQPYDVRAMVIQGALTLTRDGATRTRRARRRRRASDATTRTYATGGSNARRITSRTT